MTSNVSGDVLPRNSIPRPNTKEYPNFKHMLLMKPTDASVYPLILKRNPESYAHVTSVCVVGRTHEKYSSIKTLINHWCSNIPKGKRVTIDMSGKWDLDDLTSKSWYVIDLRAKPDVWENEIKLQHLDTVPKQVMARMCFELYEHVRAIIVFADSTNDIPVTLMTPAAWGVTQESNQELTEFIYAGCAKAMTNITSLAFNANEPTTLHGFNRFEDMPLFVRF